METIEQTATAATEATETRRFRVFRFKRGDRGPHTCKHVRGLQGLGRGSNELDLAQMAGSERTP